MTNIAIRQNNPRNIERQAAARQIFSDVKVLMGISLFLGVIIPIAISITGFVLSNGYFGFKKLDISVFSGIAGFFLAVAVEILNIISVKYREKGAKILELFDTEVFGFDWDSVNVGDKPLHDDVFNNKEKFLRKLPFFKQNTLSIFTDWYTKKASIFSYPKSVVFCQQENLCWDKSLRKDIVYWSKLSLIIVLTLVTVLGFLADYTLVSLFSNVILLIAPIILFFWKVIAEHKSTVDELTRLRNINEDLVNKIISNTITNDEIIKQAKNLQTAIYNHRKTARPIPDWIHKITHSKKELESSDRVQQYIDTYNSTNP